MPKIFTAARVKPELLAPAGNFEKLEIAIHYGADAVYLAGEDFSLRNFSDNFSRAELFKAVAFAHQHQVKVYLACNIYSRNHEQEKIRDFLSQAGEIGPDAVIISDPGIILLARDIIPQIPIHLSTQANTTNINAVKFWHGLGVKRVNLARELSLSEIREIASRSPMETETFIHGALCISYSGRCLLSSFLSGRDSNRGLCSHPCRWKYAVVEELRPDQYHPVAEDGRGTYIFNSRDLCMIEHIPELIQAGITSLKIEGRMKGINYLASVVKTYRNAIDNYLRSPETYKTDPEWLSELFRVFHREYCTGFYFDTPGERLQNYDNRRKGEIHGFVGKIAGIGEDRKYIVEIRNKVSLGDLIEILSPDGNPKPVRVLELTDLQGNPIASAKPNTTVLMKIEIGCRVNDIVRKI
nr:U32 family peptidase [Desulfobacula sp.]